MKNIVTVLFLIFFSVTVFSQSLPLKNLHTALTKKSLNLPEFKKLGYKFQKKDLVGIAKDTISLDLGSILWKGKSEKIFKELETEINKMDSEKQEYTIYNDSKIEKRYSKQVIVKGTIFLINQYFYKNTLDYYTVEIMNSDYGSDGE